ncbi:hypothetical protein BCF33_1957 [Hasllibacter halocynthiae]|uniref:Uncharacterized protein n=1 Tax=Hasllibacter halocynthiae TaxID=595589 RepID=A0A2T0X2C1_9RHOB|nr:hypothetical protein BCF33_1957 [Hasllibacter halocynthiae]
MPAALFAVAALCAVPFDTVLAGVLIGVSGCAILLPAFEALSGLRFPFRLHAQIAIFVAAALLLGEWSGIYEAVPAWDLALHLVSAAVLSVAGLGLALTLTGGTWPARRLWVAGVLAFGFSQMVGALWEVLEFGLDIGFGLNTQRSGLPDTMTDVIANALGGVWGAVAGTLALAGRVAVVPAGLMLDTMAANPVLWPRWRGPSGAQGEVRRPLAGEDGAFEGGR